MTQPAATQSIKKADAMIFESKNSCELPEKLNDGVKKTYEAFDADEFEDDILDNDWTDEDVQDEGSEADEFVAETAEQLAADSELIDGDEMDEDMAAEFKLEQAFMTL